MKTFEELYDLLYKQHQKDLYYLYIAMNDWPVEVDSVSEYLSQVKNFLNIEYIDIEILKNKIEIINVIKNAWAVESITGLILFIEHCSQDNVYLYKG